MKRFIRTTVALATILFYTACQKENTGVIRNINSQDSTATNTDSTGIDKDSLTIISFSPDSGRVGATIQIIGTGFDTAGGNLVLINTTAAHVVNASKTVVTIQVTAGSTSGKISVTANGKTALSRTNFVVLNDSAVSDSTVSNTKSWVRKADVAPGSHQFINGFSINGIGYLFTGATLWAYNPVSNVWTEKKPLPSNIGHRYGFCFVLGTKAYIGLGAGVPGEDISEGNFSHKNYKGVWAYDATQDTWTQKHDFPGAARVVPFSFSVDGAGYIGGGDTSNFNFGAAHDFWKYDAALDSWKRLSDFPSGNTIGFSGFALSGAGYVLEAGPGNPTAPVSAAYTNKLWKYNIVTNAWLQKANLPTQNFVSGVTFTIGTKAYAALGIVFDPTNPPAAKEDFWQYDPDADTWMKKADTGGSLRWLGTGFSIGTKGYVGLGTGNTADDVKNDFWAYTPE